MMTWRRESILDIYNFMLGIFLLAAPWLFASTHGVMGQDAWVSGVLVVALSATALVAFAEWEEWGLLLLGLWLAVSPWLLGFENVTAMKVNVGIGLAIAYLAAIELWIIRFVPPPSESR